MLPIAAELQPLGGSVSALRPNPRVEALRLRELASDSKWHLTKGEFESALLSPREGVQVVAGQCLCSAPMEIAAPLLRAWLLRSCERHPSGSSVVQQAAKCYAKFLAEEEHQWIIDLYLRRSETTFTAFSSHAHDLRSLVQLVSPSLLLDRLSREAANADPSRRCAAFEAALWLAEPQGNELLGVFKGEQHLTLRGRVRAVLRFRGLLD